MHISTVIFTFRFFDSSAALLPLFCYFFLASVLFLPSPSEKFASAPFLPSPSEEICERSVTPVTLRRNCERAVPPRVSCSDVTRLTELTRLTHSTVSTQRAFRSALFSLRGPTFSVPHSTPSTPSTHSLDSLVDTQTQTLLQSASCSL